MGSFEFKFEFCLQGNAVNIRKLVFMLLKRQKLISVLIGALETAVADDSV